MHGTYQLTLPLGKTNLYTAIMAIPGAIPTGNSSPSFILPTEVASLDLQIGSQGAVTLYNSQGLPGLVLAASSLYQKMIMRNVIDLAEYFLSPAVANTTVNVDILSL